MKSYIWPLLFIIVMTVVAWFFFFWIDIFENNEKRFTALVGFLGLVIGVFQFWVHEVSDRRKLKYEAYKELHKIVDSIFQTMNHEMITDEFNAHRMFSNLINLVNQFKSSVTINSDLFFKGLAEKNEAIKVRDTLDRILNRSDQLRVAVEKNRTENKEFESIIDSVQQMNWHNDSREYLKELDEHKWAFYKTIQSYF
jgi:hypothetical protein